MQASMQLRRVGAFGVAPASRRTLVVSNAYGNLPNIGNYASKQLRSGKLRIQLVWHSLVVELLLATGLQT